MIEYSYLPSWAGKNFAGEGLGSAEHEDAGAALADFVDFTAGDAVAGKEVGGVAVEPGAGRGGGGGAGAGQEGRAQLDLEPADRLRDRRLREEGRLGRAGEAVVIDDGLEEGQRVGVDGRLLEKLIESSIESIPQQRPRGVWLSQQRIHPEPHP